MSVEAAVVGEGNSLKNNLRFWIKTISVKKESVQNYRMYTVKKVSEFGLVTSRLRTGKLLTVFYSVASWHYCRRRQCFSSILSCSI